MPVVSRRPGNASPLTAVVEVLQEIVGCQLDFLVSPLGRSVVAGDEPHPVQPAEVAVDERVPSLGLITGLLGNGEVPLPVLLPVVVGEERVLVVGRGLHVGPAAAQYVPTRVDQ